MKDLNKHVVHQILAEMSDFLLIANSPEEVDQIIESTHLDMAVRFLKSPFMEKRLNGLHDIKVLIE